MSLDMFVKVFTVGELNRDNPVYSLCYIVGPALGLHGVGSSVRGFLRVDMGQEGGDGEDAMCSDVVWIS